jgi:putative restriction endonuclease
MTQLTGFIAVTDPGWVEFLGRQAGPRDANFWRPSTRPVRLAEGTPFFFKLKAPFNVIAGFGYFAGFTVLPDWLAWDTFGEANGVGSLADLRGRLLRIQQGARIEADPAGRIGCSLIAEARFLERDQWIAAPENWKTRTVTGTEISLESGEGRRIWNESQSRTTGTRLAETSIQHLRYGNEALYRPRLGQSIFRVKVLDAYGRACAVTGEHSLPVLEAAHIRPYSSGGEHAIANGLCLRTDLHRLFDRGYVTIDEDHRFVVGRKLKEEFENGESYYLLHGNRVRTPSASATQPDEELLRWHRSTVFRG